jgi:hypothetical protein
MTDEKYKDHEQRQVDNPVVGPSESRRRFAKSGLTASGVLLTLASRPVLGGVTNNLTCQAPSGFASGNLSQHGTPLTCTGRTPGYWGTQPTQWPSPYSCGNCNTTSNSMTHNTMHNATCTDYKSDGTPFHSNVCVTQGLTQLCGVFAGSEFGSKSLMQVIWLNGNGDLQQLGAHIAAALLNAQMGWTAGVLSVSDVINIWNEYSLKGYFEPTAGVQWSAGQIVDYLQSTMTL